MLPFIMPPTPLKEKLNGVADRLGCPVDEECPSSMRHILADRKHLCHPPEMSPTTSHKSSVAPRCSSADVRLQTATSDSPYQQYYSRVGTSSNCWQLRGCSLPLYRTWVIMIVLIKSQNWALISTIFTWIHNVTASFPILVSFAPFIASLPAVKMPNLNFRLSLKMFL